MNQDQDRHYFDLWFKNVLERLHEDKHAGLPIMMIALPLLERYLREKTGIQEQNVNYSFYDGLVNLFPELQSRDVAEKFWKTYRHGLLHQVAMSQRGLNRRDNPPGYLGRTGSAIRLDYPNAWQDPEFWVDPNEFSRKVLQVIDADFDTFRAPGSSYHPFPTVEDRGNIGKASSEGESGTSGESKRP